MLESKNFKTKDYILCSVLMALTFVMTTVVQIPVVGTQGYLNMGDSVILFSAMYLGKKHGFIVGSLGSALADIVSGYAIYFPITFVAKGLEGFICGYLSEHIPGFKGKLIANIIGGCVMVSGYFIGEIFIYGLNPALMAIIPNMFQAAFGISTALIIYYSIAKIRINLK